MEGIVASDKEICNYKRQSRSQCFVRWISLWVMLPFYDSRSKSLVCKKKLMLKGVNPCFNGRYSQSGMYHYILQSEKDVLILVLMEDTLRERLI